MSGPAALYGANYTTPPGQTTAQPADPPPGLPAPTTVLELVGGDSIPGVFTGGLHPESVVLALAPVASGLQQATDSAVGHLGGLVPKLGSPFQPGPAGGAATASVLVGLPQRIAQRLGLGK